MKAFSPAETGEVDRVIGTSTRAKGESQDEVIIQCPLETSGHTRLKGEDHKFLVAQLPLATMEDHFDPKIKIPGDESSCNNRASYLHNWNQLAVGCLAIR